MADIQPMNHYYATGVCAMKSTPIYTIGYGSRNIDGYVELLQRYEIDFIIDVRSHPYSRFKPEFSKAALERRLKNSDIRYVFMGDTLGGQPDDETCYTDGKVDYGKCCEKPMYQEGVSRVQKAWEMQLRVALMCSEGKPQECHRSALIGEMLTQRSIKVVHIDEEGPLKTHEQVVALRLGHHPDQPMLIDVPVSNLTSRKRYRDS